MTNGSQQLHFHHWKTEQECRAVVVLVHGLGEHCGRYQHVADAFNQNGLSLYSMDLPGHGKSSGLVGHIDSFDDYQQAALTLYQQAKTDNPDKPIFLLGHSMGGLIATQLLINHQQHFAGALLSGAAIESPQQPPAIQVAIIKFLASIAPKLRLIKLEARGISRDSEVVEKYFNDPLVGQAKLTSGFLVSMLEAMNFCKANANKITLPIKIMHGGDDNITSPEGSEWLFNHISSEDKDLVIYNGLYHEIFNEPEQQQVIDDTIGWINKHLS